jgi:hypothetical protein
VLAKKIGPSHELALSLWETGNIDAQLLAILLIKPRSLSAEEIDRMVRSVTFAWVADWLNSYLVRQHPHKETLRQQWMAAKDRWAARAGWSLTSERVEKSPEGLDLPAVDDERNARGNRHPLRQTPQACHRHWREIGRLSGLSGVEGVYLTLRADLDQCDREPARLSEGRVDSLPDILNRIGDGRLPGAPA